MYTPVINYNNAVMIDLQPTRRVQLPVSYELLNVGVNIKLPSGQTLLQILLHVITLLTYYSVFLLNITLSPELTSIPLKLLILRRFQQFLPPVHVTQKTERLLVKNQ